MKAEFAFLSELYSYYSINAESFNMKPTSQTKKQKSLCIQVLTLTLPGQLCQEPYFISHHGPFISLQTHVCVWLYCNDIVTNMLLDMNYVHATLR